MTIKVVAPRRHHAAGPTDHGEGGGGGTSGGESSTPPKPLARMRTQRLREKERLIELNHRLEDYLEKVRQLESENNSLIELISDLKHKMLNSTTTVKNDYEFPLNILKNSLNAEMTNEAMARLKLRRMAYLVEVVKMKVREAESERSRYAEKIDELTRYNENLEAEKEMLKEKVGNSINDVLGYRVKIEEMSEKLSQVNDYLDKQTLERIQYQIENRRLMEDIGFCRAIHDTDKNHMDTMNAIKNQIVDTNYYKTELDKTVQLVKDDFKRILDDNRVEMETFYQSNLEKLEIETKRREEKLEKERKGESEVVLMKSFRVNFADDLTKLKHENSMLEKRYQEMNQRLEEMREFNRRAVDEREDLIQDLKACVSEQMESLRVLKAARVGSPIESEIKIYRKLLDIGQQSLQKTHEQTEQLKQQQQSQTSSKQIAAIEAPIYVYDSKVKNLKEIKGPVGIREVSFDSRCIVIENMSDKTEFDMGGWYVERTFEGEHDDRTRKIKVTLPDGSFLERKSRLNLWAGYVDNVTEDFKSDILYRHLTDWGNGSVQVTRLYDRENNLKAIHTKNVIY